MSQITRRDFLKGLSLAAAAANLPLWEFAKKAEALELPPASRPKVAWLQNQDCTGCSISFTFAPELIDLITGVINVEFHPNLSFASGESAKEIWADIIREGGRVIIAEGAIPLDFHGAASHFGETAVQFCKKVFESAGLIIAVGTCASFGGISGAIGNPTGSSSVEKFLSTYCGWGKARIRNQLITLPGCPVHPAEIVSTVAYYLTQGKAPQVNDFGAPKHLYGHQTRIHENCLLRADYSNKNFAKYPGDNGCLFEVGCKGVIVDRKICINPGWNQSGNNCIKSRSGCKGCGHPDFMQTYQPFFTDPEEMKIRGSKS